ncbi:MAG: DUF1292 domain-containing protein [Bacilli bacterium]|nr:DUF1292 domain-containing protein [Bacilli bacterium]
MTNKTFYVVNEAGIRVEAKILSKFKTTNQNEYITYTYNEINEEGMIKIYVSGIIFENGIYSYKEINDDQEWNEIKNILKVLAKSEDEPFPASIVSNLKIVGEEVSIRKPKKLLVSKKFADVLESKYVEDVTPDTSMPKDEDIVPIDLSSIIPEVPASSYDDTASSEDDLNKTIRIPTFEELQARNKNIQAVMETAKEEKPIPEPVEPVRRELPTMSPITTNSYESHEPRVKKSDYEEKFKKDVEPVLLDVYAKQQKHIEELEEELSKTKFDLFEKQKEALSLSNENEAMLKKSRALEEQLNGVQEKMDGILNVLQGKKE